MKSKEDVSSSEESGNEMGRDRMDLAIMKLSKSVSYWECRGRDDSGDGEGGVRAREGGWPWGKERKRRKCTSSSRLASLALERIEVRTEEQPVPSPPE
jgi:hypothetical protein